MTPEEVMRQLGVVGRMSPTSPIRIEFEKALAQKQATELPRPTHADVDPPEVPYQECYLEVHEMTELTPVEWLLPGFLPKGGLTQLTAASGTGKSFVALDWALTLASEGRKVMYVAAEGFQGMAGRIRAWRKAHGELPKGLAFLRPEYVPNLLNEEEVTRTLENIQTQWRSQFDLIILDTLARVMAGNENEAEVVGAAVKACSRITASTDAAVLLVHHFGWGESRQRGSSALYGACDAVVHMEPVDKARKISKVYVEKMKDGESGREYHVQVYAPDATTPDEATIQRVNTPQSNEAVLEALVQYGPITAENLKGHVGMGRDGLVTRLKDLEAIGSVVSEAGPKNGTYWRAIGKEQQ